MARLGSAALAEAVRTLDARDYRPPAAEPLTNGAPAHGRRARRSSRGKTSVRSRALRLQSWMKSVRKRWRWDGTTTGSIACRCRRDGNSGR